MTSSKTSESAANAKSTSLIAAEELFRGRREIVIVHQGQSYLLRITRNDKLILTK
ncbi:MAG: hemin uptake protein HemP [Pseudomonadales bacterium]